MKNGHTLAAIVSTPMQHICAVERLRKGKWNTGILVVLHSPVDYAKNAFQRLPGFELWERVLFVSIRHPNVSGILGRLRRAKFDLRVGSQLRRLVSSIEKSDAVLMGNPMNFWHRAFTRSIRHQVCIVVDDGLLTVNLDFDQPDFFKETVSDRVRRFVFGMPSLCELENVELFSTLPLVSQCHAVSKNDLNFLRSQNVFKQGSSEEVWFVGQPLCQAGLTSTDSYISTLSNVKELYFANDDVVYCPHPQELSVGFDQVIIDKLGWKVRVNTRPIELQLLDVRLTPKCVATFYSSVIMTIPRIFRNQIPLWVFVLNSDRHLLPGKSRAKIVELYSKLSDMNNREHNFRMVDL